MAYTLWSQDVFSKGELSPFMYARATVNQYGDGLKTAQNVLNYPTGAAGKRFGTIYQSTLTGFTRFDQFFFETFQYLNECVYQLVFAPGFVYIYLEGLLVYTLAAGINANQAYNLSTTVLGAIFRGSTFGGRPFDLSRRPNVTANPIVSVASNILTVSGTALPVGVVLPVRFTTAGSLPVSTPQIIVDLTYFVFTETATTVSVYASSTDAKQKINAFTITTAGVASNIRVFNTWVIGVTPFKNTPSYDFNGAVTSYDGSVFTITAVTGAAVNITCVPPYAPLDASYIGGAFIAAGGTSRIVGVTNPSVFTVAIQKPFDAIGPVQGSLVYLAEPAWSDKRGWPQVCSSYQNRALFANSTSLANGFWGSTINDYSDFSDLTGDDDDAIAWYPSSNNVNYIRFIVPYRSLTVHTNTGIYSSPLSDIAAITPSNFTLQLQDSTPADTVLPQAIDNQVLVLSGNDAHQMLWDGINNAYTSDIVSIISEQLIRSPLDEVAFSDLKRAGSRYVFIINADGSMAIFQTLISQSVSGFTPAIMEQTYGDALFRQAASSSDGRCWFVVERQVASAGSPISISGFTSTTLQATASNLSTTTPTAVIFTTSSSLPASSPQIELATYYWVVGIDADNFMVYLNQEDALAAENNIAFTNAGTNSSVTIWGLNTIFTMEELTKDTFLDCAIKFNNNGSPVDTITTGPLFNAQNIKMVGDGFGFDAIGINNQVVFEAHGAPVDVDEGYIGFAINTVMEPMPLTIATGQNAKTTGLTKPTHVRSVRFWFNDTIGGEINGIPIAIKPFSQVGIGEPPIPANGIVEQMVMKAWDDVNNPTFTITHSDPFNIELLGVFYSVDV